VPQLGNAVRDLSRLILRHEVRRRQPEFDYGNKQIKAAPNGKALLFNASWPRSLPPRIFSTVRFLLSITAEALLFSDRRANT
jgi:hypothetical protein